MDTFGRGVMIRHADMHVAFRFASTKPRPLARFLRQVAPKSQFSGVVIVIVYIDVPPDFYVKSGERPQQVKVERRTAGL